MQRIGHCRYIQPRVSIASAQLAECYLAIRAMAPRSAPLDLLSCYLVYSSTAGHHLSLQSGQYRYLPFWFKFGNHFHLASFSRQHNLQSQTRSTRWIEVHSHDLLDSLCYCSEFQAIVSWDQRQLDVPALASPRDPNSYLYSSSATNWVNVCQLSSSSVSDSVFVDS